MIKGLMGKGSIKKKVIFLVTSQLTLALFCTLIVVILLVNRQVGAQTEKLFASQASSLNQAIEQRLSYLTENSQLLATNELMVNALVDSVGRQVYLTPLVSNFVKGKNVLNLDVVDFDGGAIFQMGEPVPGYNQSEQLRTALALHQTSFYIDQANHLVLISPIEYYSTTQGALIIRFDLEKIVTGNIDAESGLYTRLIKDERVIYSKGYHPEISYKSYRQDASEFPLFTKLGIILEVGLPASQYQAPVREAVLTLVIIGIILLISSIVASRWVAHRISAPILELSSRVKRAHAGQDVRCSPLGSDDELESLAKAFDERTLMLEYQAQHDDLTELPNRVLFLDRLQHSIKVSQRTGDKFALLFIDLDRFKEVNDSYGHGVGDQLIQVVAGKIADNLRDCDSVARMGGDEFTVLIEGMHREEDVSVIVQKFLALFDDPLSFAGYQFYLTCSIGIALYPADGRDAEELLKNADAAMYEAKAEGRNTYRFYKQSLTETILERIQLEHDMRRAIEVKQFQVYFQPQYSLTNGSIIGMEALLRWKHPVQGLISPFNFIPLAEETGMIVEIDRIMMHQAISAFTDWQQAGLKPGILSMNLSMVQLNRDDFIDFVKDILVTYEVSPRDLMFEVTETQAMLNPERTIVMLEQLKALGVGLAIDDFGTGFSSLSYLKRFPINKIKIDRSFISNIPEDKDDEKLTRAIIAMSDSLNMSVIAEGVETRKQVTFLQLHGCLEAQGYLFSKPVPVEQLTELLKQARDAESVI